MTVILFVISIAALAYPIIIAKVQKKKEAKLQQQQEPQEPEQTPEEN